MANITINIPDQIINRVINGIAYNNGYRDQLLKDDHTFYPNPESKAVFAKKAVIKFVKNSVKSYERDTAIAAAKQIAEDAVDSEVGLT